MSEVTRSRMYSLLVQGKSIKDVASTTGVSYGYVAATRSKMVKAGILEPIHAFAKRTRKKNNPEISVFNPSAKEIEVPAVEDSTPIEENTPVLATNFTRLIVNDTEVNISKAKEVVINRKGIKIVY